jgi:phosphatidylglycerophosphate synthase
MSSSRPSIAELRAVSQPASVVGRRSAEHWAGRLYMRDVSIHVTRRLIATRVTPDSLTLLMIVVGLFAAGIVTVPTLWAAVLAAVLVQVYLLLDCVDGELARWRRTTSAAGVYLDRLGHHVVEAALVLGLGFRAAGGITPTPTWWVTLGAVSALLVVIGKLESDLVTVARAGSGLPTEVETDPTSSVAQVRRLRRVIAVIPVHRLIGAVELALLLIVAAVVDLVSGGLLGTRVLLGATTVVAFVVALGHPITILTSQRLR